MSKNTTIQHKRSSVSGNTPDSDQIEVGELAINFPDQTLYTKDANGQIIEVGGGLWTDNGDGNISYAGGAVEVEELDIESGRLTAYADPIPEFVITNEPGMGMLWRNPVTGTILGFSGSASSTYVRSTDNGATWQYLETPLTSSPYITQIGNFEPGPVLFATNTDGSMTLLGNNYDNHYTTDDGLTWTPWTSMPKGSLEDAVKILYIEETDRWRVLGAMNFSNAIQRDFQGSDPNVYIGEDATFNSNWGPQSRAMIFDDGKVLFKAQSYSDLQSDNRFVANMVLLENSSSVLDDNIASRYDLDLTDTNYSSGSGRPSFGMGKDALGSNMVVCAYTRADNTLGIRTTSDGQTWTDLSDQLVDLPLVDRSGYTTVIWLEERQEWYVFVTKLGEPYPAELGSAYVFKASIAGDITSLADVTRNALVNSRVQQSVGTDIGVWFVTNHYSGDTIEVKDITETNPPNLDLYWDEEQLATQPYVDNLVTGVVTDLTNTVKIETPAKQSIGGFSIQLNTDQVEFGWLNNYGSLAYQTNMTYLSRQHVTAMSTPQPDDINQLPTSICLTRTEEHTYAGRTALPFSTDWYKTHRFRDKVEIDLDPTDYFDAVNKKYVDSRDITLPDGGGESSEIIWNGNSTTLTATWPLLISANNVDFGSTATIQQGRTLYLMWDGEPGSGIGIDSPHGTVLEGTVTSSEGEVWHYEFTVQKEVTFLIHESVDSNEEVGGYSATRIYEVTGVNSYVYPHGSSTGDSAQYEVITDASTRAVGYLDLPATDSSSPATDFMVNGDKFRLRHRNPNATDTTSTYNIKMAGDSADWTTVTAGAVAVPTTPSFTNPTPVTEVFDVDGMISSTPFKMSDGTTTGHVSTDWEITRVNVPTSSQVLAPDQHHGFYHANFGYHIKGRLFNSDGSPTYKISTDGQTWTTPSGTWPYIYTTSNSPIAANNDIMVVVGGNNPGHKYNGIYWSEDGSSFTSVSDADKDLTPEQVANYMEIPWHRSVIWTGTNFVIFAAQYGAWIDYSTQTPNNPAAYILLYSSDGKTWTDGSAGVVAGSVEPESLVMQTNNSAWSSAGPVWTGSKIIAIFNGYEVMTSPDGVTWTSEHVFDHIVDTLLDASDRSGDLNGTKLSGFKHYDPESGYVYVTKTGLDESSSKKMLRAHIDDLSTWTEFQPLFSSGERITLPKSIVYDSDEELYIGLNGGHLVYCRDADLIDWFGKHKHSPVGRTGSSSTTHIANTKTPQGYLCAISNNAPDNGFDRESQKMPVGYVTFESEDRLADTTNLTTYELPLDASEFRFMRVRYNTATESSLWSDLVTFNTGGAEGWYDETETGYYYPVENLDVPEESDYVVHTQDLIDLYPDQVELPQGRKELVQPGYYCAQSTTAMHYGNSTGAYVFNSGRYMWSGNERVSMRVLNLYLQDKGEGNNEPASTWWCTIPWSLELFGVGAPFENHGTNGVLSEFVYSDDRGNGENEYAILTVGYSLLDPNFTGPNEYGLSIIAFESPHNGDLRMYPTAHVTQAQLEGMYGELQKYSQPKKLIRDMSSEFNPLTIAIGGEGILLHINLVSRNDGSTSPSVTLRSELKDLYPTSLHDKVDWYDGYHDGSQFFIYGIAKNKVTNDRDVKIATSPDGITWTDRTPALESQYTTTVWPKQWLIDEGAEAVELEDRDQLVQKVLNFTYGTGNPLACKPDELRIVGAEGIMFVSTDGGVSWTRDTSLYDHMQLLTKRGRPPVIFSLLWHQTYDLAGNKRNGNWVANAGTINSLLLKTYHIYGATQTPGRGWKSPATRKAMNISSRMDMSEDYSFYASTDKTLVGSSHSTSEGNYGDPRYFRHMVSRKTPALELDNEELPNS